MMEDPDETLRALATEDDRTFTETLSNLVENVFPSLIIPPSKTEHMSALMELKAGVGGSESNLFLAELMRMYLRYAQSVKWETATVSSLDTPEGGVKNAVIEFKGQGAYDSLRWESGVHRVQRVPATEASGRVHTSTVAVVVLPLSEESDQANRELFSMDDVKVEVMRARGAGGQHVNKTESAVRLTHTPTGITVSMQDERSQHQNKRRAFQVLAARLMDQKLTREMAERRAVRQNLVKTADRSEKIRTYNYAQDRVTDHRLGLSVKNLENVMEGDGVEQIIDKLVRSYQESRLEEALVDSTL